MIASLLAAAAVAGSPMQFDLVCTGTHRHGESQTIDAAPGAPWSATIAADLQEGAYCEGGCPARRQIFELTPDKITLEHERDGFARVDRTSGAYSRETINADGSMDSWKGTCRREPFSGLPSRRF